MARHRTPAKVVRRTLTIDHLAHRGDGVAITDNGAIYVPYTLPGEEIEADVAGERGSLIRVLNAADNRVAAPCPHFGACGGCALQHMAEADYQSWKREQVVAALKSRNIETDVPALVPVARATRRRATFAATRHKGSVLFGFHSVRSHEIVALEVCHVLVPFLQKALPVLRDLSHLIVPKRGTMRLTVLANEQGLDVRLDDFGDWPDFAIERALMDYAVKAGFARLSLGDTVLIETHTPVMLFGDVAVAPPPGGFVQATAQSEAVMTRLVLDALSGIKYVTDLFAGSGTFALQLAKTMRVHAVESNAASSAALDKASRAALGLKPVKVERRDLFQRPLMARELNVFDAIVLDPPRAGAEAQVFEIARSKVRKVVYVSCAPASFARDARVLLDAGYALQRVTPVDQFLFSHHIELVGVFVKED